jgi:hypothetical protein
LAASFKTRKEKEKRKRKETKGETGRPEDTPR